MTINVFLAPWAEAQRRNVAGSLADDLRGVNGPTDWLVPPTAWKTMDIHRLSHVIVSLEKLKPVLDRHNRQRLLPATERLFEYSQNFQLDVPMGKQFIAVSLESCTEIVKGFDSTDFDALQRLYRKHCLTDCREGEPDDRYESCFLSILLQWREAAAEARTRKWGLLGVAA